MSNYLKNQHHRITVSEMAPHVHQFYAGENKADKIAKWLINWITLSLECGKIKPYDLMPTKADLACHIGVSQGTMQNAYRIVEDFGYLESKQRIGTYVKDCRKDPLLEKLTSKRELTIENVKKYLIENNYQTGDKLPSTRKLSKYLGVSAATIRTSLVNLVSLGILDKWENSFILAETNYKMENVESKTLVEKISSRLIEYIKKNYKPGDKLLANAVLAKKFKVSLKTIHDSIRYLTKEGFLYPRRGRYGTVVVGQGENLRIEYSYEKIEQKIRNYIISKCKIGDKLPSIKQFSEEYGTSEKTVKKALDNLSYDGYITFSRGRYGGTFVTDIPEGINEAYKWLALNPEYLPN